MIDMNFAFEKSQVAVIAKGVCCTLLMNMYNEYNAMITKGTCRN